MTIKHAADAAAPDDGVRVLVERRWPLGMSAEDVAVDLWLREAAPSDALRRWFGRGERAWGDFLQRYRAEIANRRDLVRLLHELDVRGPVTLLHAGHDPAHNNAAALKRILDELP